jgi:hypothetical protein
MRLIVEIDLDPGEGHIMTVRKLKAVPRRIEALVAKGRDLLKALVKEALEQVLQSEMPELLGGNPNRPPRGARSGHSIAASLRRSAAESPRPHRSCDFEIVTPGAPAESCRARPRSADRAAAR